MSASKPSKLRASTRVASGHVHYASQPSRGWLYAALLTLLIVIAYWPATAGPFVLDDYNVIELYSVFESGAVKDLRRFSRPVIMLSYLANYRLSGFSPFAFHLTSIGLHVLNSLLLWRLLSALFAAAKLPQRIVVNRSWFVYGIPLLFALSPIQTESVAYVSSRSELLAVFFFFLGLWAFIANRDRRPWLTAGLVLACFAFAALSKQDKLTLPVVILLLDYLLLSGCDWRELKKSWPLYGLLSAGIVAGFFVVVRPVLFATSAGFRLDWQSYLLTQFRMYFRYIRQLLWPFELNLDPDIQVSHSLLEHGSLVALIALILILAAVVRWHRTAPVVAFGALLYFVTLAPTTGFFPLLDFAAERRLYLPSVGFFLMVLAAASFLAAERRKIVTGGALLVLAVYTIGTFQRSVVWADDLVLWQDTAEKSPEKARPWSWLGKAYDERGLHTQAQGAWAKAEQLAKPGSKEHASLLGNLGLSEARQKNYAAALAYYERALEEDPRLNAVRAQMGAALMRLGRTEDGWTIFDKAAKGSQNRYEVFVLRGQEYYLAGRYAEAAHDFQAALGMRPQSAEMRRNFDASIQAARAAGQLP
jgi:tetratricopeptide (TPR) repeat protein